MGNIVFGKWWLMPNIGEKASGHLKQLRLHGLAGWICYVWEEFKKYVDLMVGNGKKIKFWKDSWDGYGLAEDQFPNLYSLANNSEVLADIFSDVGRNFEFSRKKSWPFMES